MPTDYSQYLRFSPESIGGGMQYYDLRIPVGITPPSVGDKLDLSGIKVQVQTVSTPDDIERGRGGPVARSMRNEGIGFAVNCLPVGHEWLASFGTEDKAKELREVTENLTHIAADKKPSQPITHRMPDKNLGTIVHKPTTQKDPRRDRQKNKQDLRKEYYSSVIDRIAGVDPIVVGDKIKTDKGIRTIRRICPMPSSYKGMVRIITDQDEILIVREDLIKRVSSVSDRAIFASIWDSPVIWIGYTKRDGEVIMKKRSKKSDTHESVFGTAAVMTASNRFYYFPTNALCVWEVRPDEEDMEAVERHVNNHGLPSIERHKDVGQMIYASEVADYDILGLLDDEGIESQKVKEDIRHSAVRWDKSLSGSKRWSWHSFGREITCWSPLSADEKDQIKDYLKERFGVSVNRYSRYSSVDSIIASEEKKIGVKKITSFPHRTQSFAYDCCPTCVLMVLHYYGWNNDKGNEQTVFDALGTTTEGTSNEECESGLTKLGFIWKNVHSLEDVDSHLEYGRPVIVSGQTYPNDPHFFTVIAKDGGEYIVADPWSVTLVRVGSGILEQIWKEAEGPRWGVAVYGESKYEDKIQPMDVKLASKIAHRIATHLLLADEETKKPYVSEVGVLNDVKTKDGKPIKVMIVDGFWIRGNLSEEFTNFGQHYRCNYIPEEEFWLERGSSEDEYDFYIEHLKKEYEAMKSGKSYDKADDAGDRAEQKVRDEEDHTHHVKSDDPEKFHVKLIKTIENGLKIWKVNGELVRDEFYEDWVEGGHYYRYKWIPKNEIWLDDEIDVKDVPYVLLHEINERNLMEGGMGYDKAHEQSSALESRCRKNGTEDIEKMLIEHGVR